jgi:hypothetical protein
MRRARRTQQRLVVSCAACRTPAEGLVVAGVVVVVVVLVVGPVGGELVVVGEGEGESVGTGGLASSWAT